jgi:hypothetical protein
MFTMIIYDGNGYYQTSVNEEVVNNIHDILPREHDLMFVIQDDVEILDEDGEPLESRAL